MIAISVRLIRSLLKENQQNKVIETKRDAWLCFLSDDRPERIMEIIEKYPIFRDMYGELYEICRNVEGVINMFSKELLELAELRKAYEDQRKIREEQQRSYEEEKKENETQRKQIEELKNMHETLMRN